jgi:hypothetical protein
MNYYVIAAISLFLLAPNVNARENSDRTIIAMSLPNQSYNSGLIKLARKIKCTCGTTSKEFEEPTCTGGKKPTCQCSSPGNNPSITCM